MSTVAAPFFLALLLSLLLVRVCRRVAFKVGCVAKPRVDRWHTGVTPLFGGVAISLSAFAVVIGLGRTSEVPVLLASAAVIFIVGLVDDVITLKASTKLIAQIALASVLLFFGFRLNWLTSVTLDTLLTLVWVVGITNAFNLLDNMDGLCAGIALIVGASLMVDLVPRGGAPGMVLPEAQYLAMLGGATAGFLIYNL